MLKIVQIETWGVIRDPLNWQAIKFWKDFKSTDFNLKLKNPLKMCFFYQMRQVFDIQSFKCVLKVMVILALWYLHKLYYHQELKNLSEICIFDQIRKNLGNFFVNNLLKTCGLSIQGAPHTVEIGVMKSLELNHEIHC